METNITVITVEFDKEPNQEKLKKIAAVDSIELINTKTFKLHVSTNVDIRPDVFNFAVQHSLAVLTIQK